ncbi:AAA family ATPase [Helicobacter cetorum]|uniref:AAA family ATPase n=1 Tax=Helicobacter cetorum TaxID=138563 RepID=UPI001F256761|nr:AAA family ATPase [Helicobacter cetorum]
MPLKVTTRFLEIKNFRNIGVKDEQEKCERLYLNNSFSNDKLGGLVLIIGENNTGKSNLLKALGCFGEHLDEFKENCTPNYLGFEDTITHLGLCTEEKSGKDKKSENKASIEIEHDRISYSLTPKTEQLKSVCFKVLNNLDMETSIKEDFTNKLNRTSNADSLLKLFNEILRYQDNEKPNGIKEQFKKDLITCKTRLKQELEKITNQLGGYFNSTEELEELIETICDEDTALKDMQENLEQFKQLANEYTDKINRGYTRINPPTFPTINLKEPILSSHVDYESIENILEDYPLGKIEYFLHSKLAQIIYYKPTTSFSSKDLMTTPDDLIQSKFFNLLFNAVNKNAFEEIKNAYIKAKDKSEGYLNQAGRKYEKLINEEISKHFNQMYFQNKNEDLYYEFDFKLDSQKVSLSLFKRNKKSEEEVLELDHQSDGFRWYFDLFFNLLCSPELVPNSIVLMDETGANLSVPTRIEYRNFLKKLGQEKGITFVISTHDPFLVDADHLDELRILSLDKDLRNVNINHFSSISLDDSDSLKRIKNALGVEKRHLIGSKCVFVEGISDYNYLSAFKLLYEKEKEKSLNMVFLPINGLGKDDAQTEAILQALSQDETHAILLVDGDERGKTCEKIKNDLQNHDKLKNTIDVFKLSACEPNFKNIEDLFSQKDKIKFDLENKWSRSHIAYTSALKNDLLIKPSLVEEKTKDNFYKLLEWLQEKL